MLETTDITASPMVETQEQSGGVRVEKIKDLDDYERLHLVLPTGDGVVFRGKEEMPSLPEGFVAKGQLLTSEQPVYSPRELYQTWASRFSGQEGSKPREFIATDTPIGIIDVAIKVIESGAGDPRYKNDLVQLHQKLVSGDIDEKILNYFDAIYIAGAVDTESGEFGGPPSPDGPIMVALALAGDQQAVDALNAKRKIVEQSDQLHLQHKLPGENLSPSELEILADAHFVAVHTTPVRPEVIMPDGTRGIRATGDYDKGKPTQFPRTTVHWSLNHAVQSHMGGDFRGRATTIVAPLEQIVGVNGAPAALKGVDTYFSLNPGQELLVPPKATMVETHTDEHTSFVQYADNVIRIKSTGITTEDLRGFLAGLTGSDPENADYILHLTASKLVSSGVFNPLRAEIKSLQDPTEEDKTPARQAYLEPFRALHELVRTELPAEASSDDFTRATTTVVEKLLTGEIKAEEHPQVIPLLVESVRLYMVNKAIQEYGGKIVASDNMSAYIEDREFQEAEGAVVQKLRLGTGLHASRDEGVIEQVFKEMRHMALNRHALTTENAYQFYYDDIQMWGMLEKASWQNRRTLVALGLLTFPPKKAVPSAPIGMGDI